MYMFSKSIYLPIICWAVAAYEVVGTFVFSLTIPYSDVPAQTAHQNKWSWLLFSVVISAAVLDVVLAISISLYLRHGRRFATGRFVYNPDLFACLPDEYLQHSKRHRKAHNVDAE